MKRVGFLALCFGMALTFALFATGCHYVIDGTKTIYIVEVIGGTGSGHYYENDVCQVTATVPDGKEFLKWTLNDDDMSAEETFSFTVTEDCEVIAVFTDPTDYDGNVFSVTTQDANGNVYMNYGNYVGGTTCTVSLPQSESDRNFKGWAKVDSEGNVSDTIVSAEKKYTFEVNENVTLAAKFNDTRLEAPDASFLNFGWRAAGSSYLIELDRMKDGNGNAATVFDGRTEYVKFYIYDSQFAKTPVASFKFLQNADPQKASFESFERNEDGSAAYVLPEFVGGPGNFYKDWIGVDVMNAFMRGVIGEQYDAETTYYFATQLVSVKEAVEWGDEKTPMLFADSMISAIDGSFCESPKA